ncbi:MAG: hypothetical protein AB8B99_14365 [Phormidesmis sp.]
MEKQLRNRLKQLRTERQSGQQVLAELAAKQSSVRDTLLRINGAIQVLEEELATANGSESQSGAQPAIAQANGHEKITTPPLIEVV